MRAERRSASSRLPHVECDICVSLERRGSARAMTQASALSDISVSLAGSTAQGGRVMPPEACRNKFQAIKECAEAADLRLLTRPPGPAPCAVPPGRDSSCLRCRPATARSLVMRDMLAGILTGTQEMAW